MCRSLVLFIFYLVLMVLHQPRGLATVVKYHDKARSHDGSPEPRDIWVKRTKRQLVGVHIPETQHGDQEYLDGFRQFNQFLAEQGFDGFAHIESGHKFTTDTHRLTHSANKELGQVGEASGYEHHGDQGSYKEPPKSIKLAPYQGPSIKIVPYQGPSYYPHDLIAPSRSKKGKKTEYGDDPVNESRKGQYSTDTQDLPIKHFGGFGGGGSIGYNAGISQKGQHGGGGYKGHQPVYKGHQGGFKGHDIGGSKVPGKGGHNGSGIGGFKGHGKGGFKGQNIGVFKGHGKGSFEGQGNGGFKGHGKGGFKGQVNGGFKGHGTGGFKGHDIGGFKGHGNGGFKGQNFGGFKGHGKGGFKGHGNGGLKGQNFGGFKGHGKGGFKGHDISGFKGHGNGGFKGQNIGGFKGHGKGGFKGNVVRGLQEHGVSEIKGHGKGGFGEHGIIGLQGYATEEFNGHNSGGLKGHNLAIDEGHGFEVFQGNYNGQIKQKPQNLNHGVKFHYDPNSVVQPIEQPFNTYDVHADVKATPNLAKPDVTLMLLSDPYNLPH